MILKLSISNLKKLRYSQNFFLWIFQANFMKFTYQTLGKQNWINKPLLKEQQGYYAIIKANKRFSRLDF